LKFCRVKEDNNPGYAPPQIAVAQAGAHLSRRIKES